MADLVDKETGARVTVTDAQLQDLLASGQASRYQVAADAEIRVVDTETGAVRTASAKDLGTVLAGGFEIASAAQVVEDQKQQQFGEGVGNAVRTAAEAGFNAATLGAGDAILTGFGADPDAIQERRARNEVSAIVGTGVGLIAPVLASGGAGAPAAATALGRTAQLGGAALRSTPTALLARAGRVATEKAVERFGGGLLTRAAIEGGVGAVEGAAFGAGTAASNLALNAESALGDHETVGEYVWASAKEGALFGAAAGAGTTLAIGGAAAMTDKARQLGAKVLNAEVADELLDSFAFSTTRARKKFADDAERFITNGGAKRAGRIYREEIDFQPSDTVESIGAKMQAKAELYRERAREIIARADEKVAPVSVMDVRERVRNEVLSEMRSRGSGIESKRAARRVEKEIDEILGVREIKDLQSERASLLALRGEKSRELIGAVDEKLRVASARADELEAAAIAAERRADDIGSRTLATEERYRGGATREERAAQRRLRVGHDVEVGSAKKAAEAARKAANEARAEAVGLAAKRAGYVERFAKAPERLVYLNRKIEELSTVTYSELRRRRIAFADDLQLARKGQNPALEGMQRADRAIEREIMDGAEAAGLIDDFKSTKERISAFSIGAAAAEDTIKRDQANRFLSMSDMQSFQAGFIGDAMLFGLDMGSLGMGLLMGTANKLIREKGSQTVVALSQRVEGLRKIQTQAQQIERAADSATTGIIDTLKGAAKGARSGAGILAGALGSREEKYAAYERKRDALAQMQANPELFAQRVAPVDGAPNVTQAAAITGQRAAQFLSSKLPAQRPGSRIRADLDKTRRVSDAEVNKFLRYARAVEDPISVLQDAARGDVTREGVEALRAVYPKMYQRLVTNVVEAIADLDKPPPMSSLVQMSLVLGQPLHFSMRPEFIAAHQQMYAAAKQQQAQPRPPSQQAAPNSAQALQTPSQRIEATA